jgi:hypothetical protein
VAAAVVAVGEIIAAAVTNEAALVAAAVVAPTSRFELVVLTGKLK